MDASPSSARGDTLAEIASLAATMIAESGLDFQTAKRKAAQRIVGDHGVGRMLPDNDLVDQFLLEHLELFDPDHAQRVERYRTIAAQWLERLAEFRPYVTGAAWKGIATRHAPIHLQVFTDDEKELEFRLMDDGINYDVGEIAHFGQRGGLVPALSFWWQRDVPMLLSIYRYDDLRGALKRPGNGPNGSERGDLAALRSLPPRLPAATRPDATP